MASSRNSSRKVINLALQGGGAHGAFTWGALDKLLEDGRIDVEGVCAASAGTMNACVYAYGNSQGGPERARELLHEFWHKVHTVGDRYNPIKRMPWEGVFSWNMDYSPLYSMFDTLFKTVSPYQLNPFDLNPLRDVLEETVDFEQLRCCQKTKLFVSATHVRSGRLRVFDTSEISIDVAMASACLPHIFKAVTIDGEDYWDGGYMGNPPMFPLFYETKSRDILIVHINPLERPDTPSSAPDIMNRINEISFNSSLIKDIRAVAFVKKLLQLDMLKEEHRHNFKDVLLHSLRADEALSDLSVASKFSSNWSFLTDLRDRGREAMGQWLDKNYKHLGKSQTIDLHEDYLGSVNEFFARENQSSDKK